MKHHPLVLSLACLLSLPAQADIFRLDDDSLDIIPTKKAPAPTPKPTPPPPPKAAPIPAPPPVAPAPETPKPPTPSTVASVAPPPAPIVAPPPPQPSPFTAHFQPYRDARAAQLQGNAKAAFTAYARLIAKAAKEAQTDSPFVHAALFHREQCRLTGDKTDQARAISNLRKLLAKDSFFAQGPYAGQALLLLADREMDANRQSDAKPWLVQCEAWIKQTRAEKADPTILGDLQPKVAVPASPWQTKPDAFGNPVRVPAAPEWLLCPETCAWTLDDIESRCEKQAGQVALMEGDTSKMQKCWARVAEFEPKLAPLPQAGKQSKKRNTEASRLGFAAKHGRLMAYPGEEHLFDGSSALRKRVLLAEYLYLTEDFAQSETELREILDADDKAKAQAMVQLKAMEEARKKAKGGMMLVEKVHVPGLTDAQRDYVQATLGTVLQRAMRPGESATCFAEVFKTTSGSVTERRAVLAYLNVARESMDGEHMRKAEELKTALLKSPLHDRFSCLAHLWESLHLEEGGRKEEALRQLAWFKPEDGPFHELAKRRLEAEEKKRKVK